MNLQVVPGTGCVGSIGLVKVGTIQLIEIGTKVWIKPDKAYWQAKGVQDSGRLQSVMNKYIATDTTNQAVASVAKVCDLGDVTSVLINPPDLKPQGGSTLGGTPVVPFLSTVDGSIYDITDTASPTLVRIQSDSSSARESFDFTDYGAAVFLAPPSVADTIDGEVPP